MALLLGLATSFHVLVGGYAFLSVICWWVYKNKTRFPGIAEFGSLVLIYLVGSAFAILSVIDKLFAIAPFDSQGKFLQYYPFRLGDIMLPLTTCLLFTRAIQQVFTGKKPQQLMLIFCSLIVIVTVATWSWRLPNDILSLRDFPIRTGYNELTTEQAQSLMHKYQARYWVTSIKQILNKN